MRFLLRTGVSSFVAAFLMSLATISPAQVAPGPYEYLAPQEAFITEAWKDLLTGTGIADWTGWYGTAWTSPHAYNEHGGTDFSLQTGTPIYAPVSGTVVAVTNNIPEGTHANPYNGVTNYYGNYVQIAANGKSPNNEDLDVITAHMLPTIMVTVGQTVTAGQQLGQSDNTGNSTSEHVHTESRVRSSQLATCPFYFGHYKYPIMFNPAGTKQVGHVIRVTATSTAIYSDKVTPRTQITTAYAGQMFFASYWQRGQYCIFIPDNTSYRAGWIKATDVSEVFEGTVIQALPDAGTYVHATTLAAPFSIKATPDAGAAEIGRIVYGGGRFVADQVQNGYYHIPVPGSATWGWVLPTSRMIVYPQLYNPAVNLASRPNNDFPISENFTAAGKSMFGRPKFNRSVVKSFSPAAPSGDGLALFMTDATNSGDGRCEAIMAGKVNHRNYYVQTACYFGYKPNTAGNNYERYGVFLRDDGFTGMDQTFEGTGNCYAITYDSDDGRLRAARFSESAVTDLRSAASYVTASGWHTLRIEAKDTQIKFMVDGTTIATVTDTNFESGPCGLGYSDHFTNKPADRGAYFDNFTADTLDPVAAAQDWQLY